jgi:hypothetical protein
MDMSNPTPIENMSLCGYVLTLAIFFCQLDKFVLDAIGHVDATEYETAVPCLHLIGAKSLKHLGKLLGLLLGISIGEPSAVSIELLVVEVFYGLGRSLHHALLLTGSISTVAGRTVTRGLHHGLLAMTTLGNITQKGSEKSEEDEGKEKIKHNSDK